MKFPKAIGACADLLYALREQRLAAQKKVDALEEQERALREHVIQTLPKSEATGVSGKRAKVGVTLKTVAQVKDWDAFYTYVSKHKRFDLLQRRTSDQALRELWDDGLEVPGVEPFQVPTVSLTKL